MEKNVSPSRVAQQIGLSNAAASGWKKGKIPSDLTINKLANYFGVTVDYFAEEERPENEKKPSVQEDEGPIEPMISECLSLLRQLWPENRKQVTDFAQALLTIQESTGGQPRKDS